MFHDKLFCHRFFDVYGVKHAKVVAEVKDHKRRETFLEPKDAPKHLVWKPRLKTPTQDTLKHKSIYMLHLILFLQ